MRHPARFFLWGRLLVCTAVVVLSLGTAMAAPPQQPQRTFLIASDLHFNPMADAKLVDELNSAEPAHWESILERSHSAAFSQYGQDTNWWLLRSALNAMRTTLPHPAFILVTGDMLAHQFPSIYQHTAKRNDPESYRKFVVKTMQFLALQLRRRFPDTAILLTPGNNDDDCGDYAIEAGGPFLHDTAELASQLARAGVEMRDTWESLGSYDIPHPAIRNARLISLNTVFLSNKYSPQNFSAGCSATKNSTAAHDLLSWLEQRLSRAQQAHEKVWLMFHIPPGIDGYSTLQKYLQLPKGGTPSQDACTSSVVPMWVPQWTAQFDELLAKHRDTVVAAFAGHTHTDDFRVIGASAATASYVLITASVSPIYNQNPSFRVATFKADGSLGDDSVYYLTNLLYASSTTSGRWSREYSFTQDWKRSAVDAASLSAVYGEIADTGDDARAEWLKFYNVSSSAAPLPPGSAPALYCAIEGLSPESYGKCFCGAMAHER